MPPPSPLRPGRIAGGILAVLLAIHAHGAGLSAQVPAEPVLRGQVYVGDSVLANGTVVLHHLTADEGGEVDSATVARDGSFAFRLPTVPDPARSEMYFASIRHQGVLYFGGAVRLPVQLDSVYEIRVYDTVHVAPDRTGARVQARYIFFEEVEGSWRVTDLFQVLNEGDHTLVAEEGGVVWSHPLPPGATEPTVGAGDFAEGDARFADGSFLVSSPIPPGERMYVIRYVVPELFVEVPLSGTPEALEVLVREPAPPLEIPGLSAMGPAELETGSTYRRFAAADFEGGTVRLEPGQEVRPPPVRWLAVLFALLMAGAAVAVVMRSTPRPGTAAAPVADDRAARALLVEIARLDEAHERADPSDEAAQERYRRTRARLLRQLEDAR